jgi:hypothetical protein
MRCRPWAKNPTWFKLCNNVRLRYTYKLKMNMGEFTLKLRVVPQRKTRILSFARCDSYYLMPYLLSDNDTCHDIVESCFLWLLELRYALGDLEFMLRHDFYIFETQETRHKRVDSLKECKLQSQLAIGELGGELHNFLKCSDSSCGSVVSSWTQFHNVSLKLSTLSFQGPMC